MKLVDIDLLSNTIKRSNGKKIEIIAIQGPIISYCLIGNLVPKMNGFFSISIV